MTSLYCNAAVKSRKSFKTRPYHDIMISNIKDDVWSHIWIRIMIYCPALMYMSVNFDTVAHPCIGFSLLPSYLPLRLDTLNTDSLVRTLSSLINYANY